MTQALMLEIWVERTVLHIATTNLRLRVSESTLKIYPIQGTTGFQNVKDCISGSSEVI